MGLGLLGGYFFGGAVTTWANDLLGSTNTNQYVVGISGSGGTAGTVTLGDGTNALLLTQVASVQATPPSLTLSGSAGYTVAATNGGASGALTVRSLAGGAGQGTNKTGGNGGLISITGGAGGAATGNAANSNGAGIAMATGAAGTGGGGAAGVIGVWSLTIGGTAMMSFGDVAGDFIKFTTGGLFTPAAGMIRLPGGQGTSVNLLAVGNGANNALGVNFTSDSSGVFQINSTQYLSLRGQAELRLQGDTTNLMNQAGTLQCALALANGSTQGFTWVKTTPVIYWTQTNLTSGNATDMNFNAQGSASGNGGFFNVAGGIGTAGLKGGVRLRWANDAAQNMLEGTELIAGQRFLALCLRAAATTTSNPTGAGDGAIFIGEAATAPTVHGVGGCYLYVDPADHKLKAITANSSTPQILTAV